MAKEGCTKFNPRPGQELTLGPHSVLVHEVYFTASFSFQLVNELQDKCASCEQARNEIEEDIERLKEVMRHHFATILLCFM